jgi:hypothetical protein
VDIIYRLCRGILKVVLVVGAWGNQKAISGGMGRDFGFFFAPGPVPEEALRNVFVL